MPRASQNLAFDTLYETSRTILTHSDGTEYEDLYLISLEDGSIAAQETSSTVKYGIVYSDEFLAKGGTGIERACKMVYDIYGMKADSAVGNSVAKDIPQRTVYTKKQLKEMPIEDLREYAVKCATEWYKSGRSGISFPPGKDLEEAARELAQDASKTSLEKM